MELNTIYNCDCVNGMERIDDGSIDCVISDPPYNVGLSSIKRGYHMNSLRENNFVTAGWDNQSAEEWRNLIHTTFKGISKKVKIGGNIIIFCSALKIGEIYDMATKCGLYYKTAGVWHKTNPIPRNMNLQFVISNEFWVHFVNQKRTGTFNNEGKLLTDYYECSIPSNKERMMCKHPTQKPLAVIKRMIEVLTDKNDTVLDCFMGSGTTAVASVLTGRKFIGFEIDKNYFEAAQLRINETVKNLQE